jgi:hypothetical protein
MSVERMRRVFEVNDARRLPQSWVRRTQSTKRSSIICDTAWRSDTSRSLAFRSRKLPSCSAMRGRRPSIMLSRAGQADSHNDGSRVMNKIFRGVIGVAATILGASAASAVTIDGITVNEYGRVNPAALTTHSPASEPAPRRSKSARSTSSLRIHPNSAIPAGIPTASATRRTPGGILKAARSPSTGRATL